MNNIATSTKLIQQKSWLTKHVVKITAELCEQEMFYVKQAINYMYLIKHRILLIFRI